ncbi:MAG: helix-turn-helix transcriptional regulator [Clostridia bacterium]|nr:helix-turn-helix transcriptional regulator [Clostridia bacterium]
MTFNEKLLSLRRKTGLSQEELAEKLDVSRQAVSRWEMGETMPDAKNLLVLSDIFGVSVDYLLRDGMKEDEKEEKQEPVQTVNNTSVTNNAPHNVGNMLAKILWVALPLFFIVQAGMAIQKSSFLMLISWLTAIFCQFCFIYSSPTTFLQETGKSQREIRVIHTGIHVFISLISLIVLFIPNENFNLYIYIVLMQIYAIFAFEATLFRAGRCPYLKKIRLKFYRVNIWFFAPALSALITQTVIPVAPEANKYLLFAGILAALIAVCACVFAVLTEELKKNMPD